MQHNDAERQNAVLLIQQLEDLVKRISELELRQDNADDELKSLASSSTPVGAFSSDEGREQRL
ncbi:MAG TPA: hypothetical protein V6C76_07120 [Drouetiella sp.]